MSKDYYKILGVEKTATDDELKKAFRRLAHEHHPDKGGDQQKFKDINEAYQVLGDKEKRAKYDRFGSAAFEQGGFGGGQGFGGGFGGFQDFQGGVNFEDLGDLGDILGGMFGFDGGRGGQRVKRGRDIETELVIDFLEAAHGAKKQIKLYKNSVCAVCQGTGAEPGSKMETCKTCNGKGQVQKMARTIFGAIQSAVTCPECQGQGQRRTIDCKHCSGAGIEKTTKEYSVDVPAGIDDGEALKLNGEGEHPGVGGRPGDLFVRIRVKAHSTFSREGQNVLSTAEIPYSTLQLGGEVMIDTVDGPGSLKIPEATTSGTVFKLHAKGFPYLRGHGRGDHLVTIQAKVEKKITHEQKNALEELKKTGL